MLNIQFGGVAHESWLNQQRRRWTKTRCFAQLKRVMVLRRCKHIPRYAIHVYVYNIHVYLLCNAWILITLKSLQIFSQRNCYLISLNFDFLLVLRLYTSIQQTYKKITFLNVPVSCWKLKNESHGFHNMYVHKIFHPWVVDFFYGRILNQFHYKLIIMLMMMTTSSSCAQPTSSNLLKW